MITTNSNASTATYFIEKIIGHKFNIHEILIFFFMKTRKIDETTILQMNVSFVSQHTM